MLIWADPRWVSHSTLHQTVLNAPLKPETVEREPAQLNAGEVAEFVNIKVDGAQKPGVPGDRRFGGGEHPQRLFASVVG